MQEGNDRQATYRRAVRVLLIDERSRVLLFCYPEAGGGPCYWVPPGGGLLPGEDHEAAAHRELREETGLTNVAVHPLGWRRRLTFAWGEDVRDQDERWFYARCTAADVDPAALDRVRSEGATDARWWSLSEIVVGAERFVPARLGELLPGLLAGDVDPVAVDVGE